MSQTPSMSIPLDLLPLGFRFRPTDEELINNYLKLKINGQIRPSDAAAIAEVDVCRFEPWDLPARSAIRSNDPEWFFFAPVDRKYPSGNRSNRATPAGYWKATGMDRFIRSRARGGTGMVVGMKKTLVFHRGRAPRGQRTHWIMHEYRAVERDFEKGGFVLCRLFRKPEETVSGTITPEPEENVFSPPTNSSLSNTLHVDDVMEGEFAAPLNQKLNMQEDSQPSPDTNNDQLTESKLHDRAFYSIPCPNKPEESHSNSNMIAVEGGQMAERKAALYDEVLAFLGPEYEHLLSDEFPQIDGISSDVDQGLHKDSVLGFLESMLSTPAMPSGLSANETGSATKAVLHNPPCAVHAGLHYSSRDVDSEALFAQGGEGLEAASHERRLLGIGCYSQAETSNRYNEILPNKKVVRRNVKISGRKSTALLESGTLPSHSTKHAEDSVGPTHPLLNEINIRLRNLENSESSTSFPSRQGVAERRIRLHSPKYLAKASEQSIYERETGSHMLSSHSSIASSYQDDQGKLRVQPDLLPPVNSVTHQNLSGAERWAGVITSKAEVHLGNQNSRRIELSEPAFAGDDHECFSSDDGLSDDDGTSPRNYICTLTLGDYEEPSLRLRTRQTSDTTSDAEINPETPSLHQERSTLGPFPIRRIGITAFVTVSLLFAGTIWYFN